jgi:hypothetical protein
VVNLGAQNPDFLRMLYHENAYQTLKHNIPNSHYDRYVYETLLSLCVYDNVPMDTMTDNDLS